MSTLEIGLILLILSIGVLSLRKPGDQIFTLKDERWDSLFFPFEFIFLISLYLIWIGWIL